jgi:SAM-dependent methyltransferase
MAPAFDDPRATWDSRFQADEYIFGTAPNRFLEREASRFAPGMSVLAVADGEGRNSAWLAARGLQVCAFDISPRGVDKARQLAHRLGVAVDYRVSRVEDWAWQAQTFDVVIAIFVQFADPSLRQRMFDGILAALAPGGLLLLEGFGLPQLALHSGGPGRPDHLYTGALLRETFSGHDIVDLQEYEAELAEGRQHAGRAALVDCIVRKRTAG